MNPDNCTKYPRTPHLPWSPGGSSDDAYLFDTRHFEGKEVIVTEKMDGENTTLYRDGLHARSIDGRHHPSRAWIKAQHAAIASEIPANWRLCGENLYARHSIAYDQLHSYFHLFSIWNDRNEALSWDETDYFAEKIGLITVPLLYRGPWAEALMRELPAKLDESRQEGFVVRLADSFAFSDFPASIAKWVRKGHVQTDQHWMFAEVVPNSLSRPASTD